MSKIKICIIIFSFIFLSAVTLQAADSGSVNGTLTINQKVTKLRYVYAMTKPGTFDESKTETVVIFTNSPLSDDAVGDWFERSKMASDGKLTCFEVSILEDKSVFQFAVRYPGSDPISGTNSYITFASRAFNDDSVAGKITCKKPLDMFGTTVEISARFNVSISD